MVLQAAKSYQNAIHGPADRINMLVKVTNMMSGQEFEIEVADEPIMHLKLQIEDSQHIPLNE